MASKLPLVITSTGLIQQIQTGDFIPVLNGGTGATTASGARTNLGLVIGTDVQAYDPTLTALAGISGTTGILVQTAADTFAQRNIVSAGLRLTITNPAGVAGDIDVDLSTLTDSATGTFLKITRDAYGRVSGTTAVVVGDISGLVDARYLQLSGGTLTNFLTLHADPTSALHASTKQYVDSMVAGQRIQDSVRVATTASGTMATSFADGQTVDGVTLATNDRILIKDQGDLNNGVYVVQAAGAPVRATDFDSGVGEVVGGATFWVNEGTANGDTAWTVTNNGTITVGSTVIVFTQSSALGQVTAGAGLTKTGSTLNVGTASSGRIVVNADDIDLASGIVTPGTYTKVTVDTYGRVTVGATATPADIGAQPVDATLTALAGISGTAGILVQTSADVFAQRSIVSAGLRLSITNPAGVAGNIDVDLASGVATPGTYNSVTVDTYGRVTSGTSAPDTYTAFTLTNTDGTTLTKFSAVYSYTSAGQVRRANANSGSTFRAMGIAAAAITNSASGSIIISGVATGTTGEWDAITGQSGGLTPGSVYFLSNTTAGGLTTTAPSTGYLVKVGIALSTVDFLIAFGEPIQF